VGRHAAMLCAIGAYVNLHLVCDVSSLPPRSRTC
jgi:hypothetical protein